MILWIWGKAARREWVVGCIGMNWRWETAMDDTPVRAELSRDQCPRLLLHVTACDGWT